MAGRWQLDRDEEMEPMHGMYGVLDELEVQRTIKRADLTAFLCHFKKAIGPTMLHVDNEGIIDGQRAKDADLWIFILEKLHRVHQEGILERIASERSCNKCRSSKSSSLKAMRKRMS